MRLTGQFAVTGLLVAALAALPLARLWAISVAYGDPLSQQVAEALAIAGAVLLALLFILLRHQLLKPLARATATLQRAGGPFDAPLAPSTTRLRDLAAFVEAVPSLRRSLDGIARREHEVALARQGMAVQSAEFEARGHDLQALVDAIPVPLALHDPGGRTVLANRAWHDDAMHSPTLRRAPVTDAKGEVIGELLSDGGESDAGPPRLADRLAAIEAAVTLGRMTPSSLAQLKALQRIADTAARLKSRSEAR